MATSILSRKRDLGYLLYFIIHIPVMFLIDLSTLYPPSLVPSLSRTLLAWQSENYKDLFFVSPPAWFVFYMWMEVFFHVPVSLWALGGLLRESPRVPVVLLVYGVQTVITTATCMADYMSWQDVTFAEKMDLTTLYGPYLVISVFMTVDMYARLSNMVDKAGMEVAFGKKIL